MGGSFWSFKEGGLEAWWNCSYATNWLALASAREPGEDETTAGGKKGAGVRTDSLEQDRSESRAALHVHVSARQNEGSQDVRGRSH